MSTEKQIAANQANAQHSTGPRTEAGKFRVATNALKTGLTGRTVLLPTDDLAEYQSLLDQITAQYEPRTDEEKLLTQKIVDTEWRLARIPELMEGLYILGYRELAPQLAQEFQDEDDTTRALLIRTRVYLHHRKELGNLSLQETRLRRQLEKDTTSLKTLQSSREAKERQSVERVAKAHVKNPTTHTRAYFEENGFVFSNRAWQEAVAIARIEMLPAQDRDYSLVAQLELRRQIRDAA